MGSVLKISKIIPIYKSGAKSEVNNYRPISLLRVLSRVFEKVFTQKNYHLGRKTFCSFIYSTWFQGELLSRTCGSRCGFYML